MTLELAGKWKRPANVPELAEREVQHPDFNQIKTPRHTIAVNYHAFKKTVERAE